MSTPTPLRRRLALAGLLTIGFYLLVLVLAVVLISLPYLEIRYAHRIHFQLLLAPLAGLALLWAAIPRREKFVEPGIELAPSDHPELFAVIAEVADATGEAPPTRVFLVGDVNAFVADIGGFFGWRSTRVMGLGLPVLHILDVEQLRAVIAHEFGHYAAGDTRLGGLLSKVRRAMQRSVHRHSNNAAGAILAWYEGVFLRMTLDVSRDQERAADALAAETTSPAATAGALRNIAAAAQLHHVYNEQVFSPILNLGQRPPWTEGFNSFVRDKGGPEAVEAAVADALAREPHQYDSHPPLAERLELLGAAAGTDFTSTNVAGTGAPMATTLLRNTAETEELVLKFLLGDATMAQLAPMQWGEYVDVLLPAWRKERTELSNSLGELTLGTLPNDPDGWHALAQAMLGNDAGRVSHQHWLSWLSGPLGRAMGVAMVDQGWMPTASPARPLRVQRDGVSISPVETAEKLISGELSAERFHQWVSQRGLADVRLAPTPGVGSTTTPQVQSEGAIHATKQATDRKPLGEWLAAGLVTRRKPVWYSATEVALGDAVVAFDAITGFSTKVRQEYGDVTYQLELRTAEDKVVFQLKSGRKQRDATTARFEELLAAVRSKVAYRLHNELVAQFEAGETINVGDCEISRSGWRPKGTRNPHPWSDFAGSTVHQGTVILFVPDRHGEPKAKSTVDLSVVNASLLPDLMEKAHRLCLPEPQRTESLAVSQ